jgi:hypothetical protein
MPVLDFPFTVERRVAGLQVQPEPGRAVAALVVRGIAQCPANHANHANQTNQTNALKTRVDLIFRGVCLLRLPNSFEDLTISSVPDAKAAADPEIAEAMLGGYQVYGLDSSGTPTG